MGSTIPHPSMMNGKKNDGQTLRKARLAGTSKRMYLASAAKLMKMNVRGEERTKRERVVIARHSQIIFQSLKSTNQHSIALYSISGQFRFLCLRWYAYICVHGAMARE